MMAKRPEETGGDEFHGLHKTSLAQARLDPLPLEEPSAVLGWSMMGDRWSRKRKDAVYRGGTAREGAAEAQKSGRDVQIQTERRLLMTLNDSAVTYNQNVRPIQ